MSWKQLTKNILRILKLEVRTISRYYNAFEMQKWMMRGSNNLTIVDVGAYDGSIALNYNAIFPNSRIYCFEPFPESYTKLKANTENHQNIMAYNLGLGEAKKSVEFQVNTYDQTNSILKTHKNGSKIWGEGILETLETISVELTTLDSFVESNNVEAVDILKIDVQGAEALVLEGAKSTLSRGIVRIVYMEIITMPTYENQSYIDEILKLMRVYGFEIINFYNQSMDANGQLRQLDAVFYNPKLF